LSKLAYYERHSNLSSRRRPGCSRLDDMHTAVTPSLFLGSAPPFDDVVLVRSAKEAIDVIQTGDTAVLPEGAWAESRARRQPFLDA
jgi:hypothetical protein